MMMVVDDLGRFETPFARAAGYACKRRADSIGERLYILAVGALNIFQSFAWVELATAVRFPI